MRVELGGTVAGSKKVRHERVECGETVVIETDDEFIVVETTPAGSSGGGGGGGGESAADGSPTIAPPPDDGPIHAMRRAQVRAVWLATRAGTRELVTSHRTEDARLLFVALDAPDLDVDLDETALREAFARDEGDDDEWRRALEH